MEINEIIKTEKDYYMPVFARYQLVLSHGEGPYVYDAEDNKYIDFLSSLAFVVS